MKTDDFDFYLPEELIAQTPILKRDESRLLVVDRFTGEFRHKHFYEIIDYLENDSVLVLNNTKVMPARLIGEKIDTGAHIELLILKNVEGNKFECLAKPQKRIRIGSVISFGEGLLLAKVIELFEEGLVHVEFIYEGIFFEILDKLGEMPLPPYIHEKLQDKDRYQTVYSKEIGSAAAPTAGLHFTKELLDKIANKGITICYITLHVGLGTFRPVNVSDVTTHKMHSEFYTINQETADILNKARKEKRKINAVGTTTVRTLETVMQKNDIFTESSGWTDIFIYPGFVFKAVDNLITNFHLPKSTLIMLVSAFSSKEIIMNAYNEAIKEKYRFFSFGDSMFLTTSLNKVVK